MLDAVQRETGLTGQKARALLGGFLFSGDDVEKQLSDISGGEQRRLSLAILVASGANVLVLDEPTNHLDIESREALEDALIEFEGAVVLISHDRALLEAVGSRTLVCEDGSLRATRAAGPSTSAARDEREPRAGARGEAAAEAGRGKRRRRRHQAGRRRRRARRRGWSSGSSGPRPSCASSRRSSPTPPPGRARAAPSGRPSATPRPSATVEELYAEVGGSARRRPRRRAASRLGPERPPAGARARPGRPWPGQGDVADLDPLRLRVGGAQVGALDELAQDRPHLVFGEGGADAAADAAAEGDPGVVVGLGVEEALGAELAAARGRCPRGSGGRRSPAGRRSRPAARSRRSSPARSACGRRRRSPAARAASPCTVGVEVVAPRRRRASRAAAPAPRGVAQQPLDRPGERRSRSSRGRRRAR